ncbi:hypothetical protein Pmani_024334 [Petrolisthes manimaculis]|uniref:Uncharacterized protein n=1 Tax=Petrolisthes manimaculis TaxID=1843537 RepID=A0AAE1U2F3_9EUCA|nr:hypothetical protein Pmani_024334 [Petrolisthes manimaculis]
MLCYSCYSTLATPNVALLHSTPSPLHHPRRSLSTSLHQTSPYTPHPYHYTATPLHHLRRSQQSFSYPSQHHYTERRLTLHTLTATPSPLHLFTTTPLHLYTSTPPSTFPAVTPCQS